MLKMFQDGCILWEVLAAVRSTPVWDQLPAPSVLLQGRNLRGSLPFLSEKLVPRCVTASFVQIQLRARRGKAAFHATCRYDVRSSVLLVGPIVRARMRSRWLPGVVEAVCKEPNSYRIRLVDGRVFRRTRWAINAMQAPPPSAATLRHFQSLRFPDVGGYVLSSAAIRQQVPTGIEPVTRVPPSPPRPRGSPMTTAPVRNTGVRQVVLTSPARPTFTHGPPGRPPGVHRFRGGHGSKKKFFLTKTKKNVN